ncbi:hypothetical protein HK104_002355, partial [Borealophlyctis nickersoniae]
MPTVPTFEPTGRGTRIYPEAESELMSLPQPATQRKKRPPAYDPSNQGPIHHRRCHDVVFLILFILYWVGMVIVAVTARRNGDPGRLLSPKDSSGQYCGTTNSTPWEFDLTTRPYLFYFNPLNLDTSKSVCVATCPNTTGVATPSTAICNYTITASTLTLAELSTQISSGTCAQLTYASSPLLDRCVPTGSIPSSLLNTTISAGSANISINALVSENRDRATQAVSDLKTAWYYLLIAPFVALIISFIWLLLLRMFAGLVVWLTIIAANAVTVLAAVFLYVYWRKRKDAVDSKGEDAVETEQWEVKALLGAFIACCVVAVVLVLLTAVMAKRVRIAVAIIKEAGRAMGKMPLI